MNPSGNRYRLRKREINQLIAFYKDAQKNIYREILTATEAGKIHRVRVLARVNAELEKLGVNVERWVAKEIPQYYQDGANQAMQQLRRYNIPTRSTQSLATVNEAAIRILVSNTSTTLAEGIRGVSRSALRVITEAQKQQINIQLATGRLDGSALRTITSSIRDILRQDGLTGLVDRSGRSWTFDRYAEMVARTKAVEARNQGLANKMLQNGYDLVEVSDHGSDHPECAAWEGKILSISGETKGYPTLDEAESAGLFHPQCQHSINVITDLAEQTEAYDNPYNHRD
jgi:hypothetical protein